MHKHKSFITAGNAILGLLQKFHPHGDSHTESHRLQDGNTVTEILNIILSNLYSSFAVSDEKEDLQEAHEPLNGNLCMPAPARRPA